MTVEQIVNEVRLCIDEKSDNTAMFAAASNGDNAGMDAIIKAKINDALIWVLLYAPAEMLDSLDETADSNNCLITSLECNPTEVPGSECSTITLPETFMRLIRVRVEGWGRAVRTPIEEDSENYIQLTDEIAKATLKTPEAAIIRKSPNVLELWPGNSGSKAHITYVNRPSSDFTASSLKNDTHIAIPAKARTAFLYYISFLVLAAYRDSSANIMLEIAKASIGKQ